MLIVYITRHNHRYRWEARLSSLHMVQPVSKCGKYPATFAGAKRAFWYYSKLLKVNHWRFAQQMDGVSVDQVEMKYE